MLSAKPMRELINATRETLSKPLSEIGISKEVPAELTEALQENIFYFSGFKTHHEMEEASRLMKGDDGAFKPFEQFKRDVQTIDNTYNRNYLKAEYNFAVQSTQMAVKWKEWEKDGDDYDLQYRTAGDERVREEHAALDMTTLPPSDPFWDSYLPPLGWNCRCTTVQVRKGKYHRSNSEESIAKGQAATAKPKQQIFRFNPGKQEKIFPPKHPYYKVSEEVRKFIETPKDSKGKSRPTTEEKRNIRREYEEFVHTLPSVKVGDDISHRKDINTDGGSLIRVSRKFFSETFNKAKVDTNLSKTMQLAKEFEQWMPKLKQFSRETGKHHDCDFAVFRFEHNGITAEMKAMIYDEYLKSYILRIIQEK